MESEMFLVDVALKATVVLLAALVAARVMRHSSAAARHATWSVALAAILIMPALSMLVPAWRVLPGWTHGGSDVASVATPQAVLAKPVARHAAVNSPVADAANAHVNDAQPVAGDETASGSPVLRAARIAPVPGHVEWRPLMMALYLMGVLAAFLPILGGVLALFRTERRARPIAGGIWAGLIKEIRNGFSIRREIILLQSASDVTMPMTWGLRRPRVLVPASADQWSAERRRVVLLHEAAHVKRWDWLTLLLCRFACCVYWFHPLAWYAAAQARLEAEHACDDIVMAAGAWRGSTEIKSSAYASELLTLAGSLRAPRMQRAGAISMARGEGPQLQARIRAILDSARNRRGFSARSVALVVILAMAAVVPLSALRAAAPEGGVTDMVSPAEGFTHDIHFELGQSRFLPGDHITITEIRGTSDKITPQNTYEIKGTYTLASADDADLAVYVTSAVINDTHHDPYDQRQTVHVTKGSGNFTVVLPFLSKGFPHLSYYPTGGGSSFSAQYFGTGETVWNAENEAKFWKAAGKPSAAKPPSVQVLVSSTDISFQGKQTTWEELPGLLEKVPDRENTVLAMALTTDEMTVKVRNEAFYRLAELSKKYGFRYLSDAGIQEVKERPATEPGARGMLLEPPHERFADLLMGERNKTGEMDVQDLLFPQRVQVDVVEVRDEKRLGALEGMQSRGHDPRWYPADVVGR